MKSKLIFLIFCSSVISFLSCKKLVDVALPVDKVSSATVFEDEQTASSAITGLYSQIMVNSSGNYLSGGVTLNAALSADEVYTTSPNTERDQFLQNALLPNNSLIGTNIWRRAYNYIYQCNAIIEGLANSKTLTASFKAQLEGEAKFIRALCYFYLVNLFGDIPLVTTTEYQVNALLPRAPVADIYQQVITDLSEAKDLLPSSYIVAVRTRPNKWTAVALLARVYLYNHDWVNASAAASSVISSGTYSLVNNPANVFLATSAETIFQFSPVQPNFNTSEGNNFLPSTATIKPALAITTYLFNAFETGDQRKTNWLKANIISGQSYYFPYKYKVKTSSPATEYNIVLRLAEMYLIRAEANARQDKVADAGADLNVIRSRAGLPPTTAVNKTDLLLAITHERQTELFCEWGHRWLDLKRLLLADSVLSSEKTGWQQSASLYPIPQKELDTNPFLVQNAGY